jgi:catalase
MVGILTQIDDVLAKKVADGLGLAVPAEPARPLNHGVPANADQEKYESKTIKPALESSAALSMANTIKDTVKSRIIAVLATDGVNAAQLNATKKALLAGGAQAKIIATHNGFIKDNKGAALKVDFTFLTSASVLFDAVYIPGGAASVNALLAEADAIHFVTEAFKHCKAIAADKEGELLLQAALPPTGKKEETPAGVLINQAPEAFITAIAGHRFWEREKKPDVPA